MKVTYNWLKDFVEIRISAQALAQKLTMAGLEITSLEKKDEDFVFELEVTSNRPDWLSVEGIAREVAAITGKKLKFGSRFSVLGFRFSGEHLTPNSEHRNLKIHIQDKKDCPLYTAKIIKDVKVAPSPDWLRKRLELIGCRTVNNIVDITNYILFTYGEPLHAFDLDKISCQLSVVSCQTKIITRRAKNKEEITTIDGIKRILDENILIIATETGGQSTSQPGRPIAVAGVMGSLDTEITQATKNILLEAAVFNPAIVRRGRRALGIQSESSYRFERGVNLEIVDNVSSQAAALIQQLAGGSCVLAKSLGAAKEKRKSVILDSSVLNKTLGINIPLPKIKKILNSLEFKTTITTKNNFTVRVPAHRSDITLEVDLIEEIARIYGYENVPQTLPLVEPKVSGGESRDLVVLIKNILVGLGLHEVITYSLTGKDLLRDFRMYQGPEVIEILNPLSKEQEILRTRLIPSLTACVAHNLNQKQDYINIFEVAKVYSQPKNLPREELRLGIALCGIRYSLLQQGLIKDPAGPLHLKGILEVLFARLGVRDYDFKAEGGASIISVYVAGETIGVIVQLEKPILDRLDINNQDVFVLEISLDRLLYYINLNKKFSQLPVYPGISRDISLLVKEEILAGGMLKAIKGEGMPLLKEAKVVDYYKGKQIPAGFKGLTISCLYRSDERTLTEAEINPAHSAICALLANRFGVQIRSCPPAPLNQEKRL